MTDQLEDTSEVTQEDTSKATLQRSLTPEQREQQNLRARQRRAAAKAAKATTTGTTAGTAFSATAPGVSHGAETSPDTLGRQQALRDKPFQHQLSDLLQAQDKARALRIRNSQDRQPTRKINKEG